MARQVKIEILGDARGLRSAFREAERSTTGFGRSIAKAGVFAATGLAGIAAGIGVAAFKSIQAAQESNKVSKQTQAVIKSTGGAAKVTTKQISDLSTALSNKTAIDDEVIQSGANMLLTFTNIRNEAGKGNDIFTQATSILTDMSVALGEDASKGAIQLGKALNDPIRGVTALQRVGVTFTQQQKDQIKTLVESGHRLEAQKVILRELGKEFGGSAAAAATPLDRLKVVIGNLSEKIGNALLPTVNSAATFLTDTVVPLLETDLPAATKMFQTAITNLQQFITNTFIPNVEALHNDWAAIVDDFTLLISSTEGAGKGFSVLDFILRKMRGAIHQVRQVLDLVTVGLLAAAIAALDLANGFLFVVEHTLGIFNPGIRKSAHDARKDIGDMRDDLNAKLKSIINRTIDVNARDHASGVIDGILQGLQRLHNVQIGIGAVARPGLPTAFQHGTAKAPGGLSILHPGEIVVPPALSELIRTGHAMLAGSSVTAPTAVAAGGNTYNFHFHGAVSDRRTVVEWVRQGIREQQRQEGKPATV